MMPPAPPPAVPGAPPWRHLPGVAPPAYAPAPVPGVLPGAKPPAGPGTRHRGFCRGRKPWNGNGASAGGRTPGNGTCPHGTCVGAQQHDVWASTHVPDNMAGSLLERKSQSETVTSVQILTILNESMIFGGVEFRDFPEIGTFAPGRSPGSHRPRRGPRQKSCFHQNVRLPGFLPGVPPPVHQSHHSRRGFCPRQNPSFRRFPCSEKIQGLCRGHCPR